MGSSRKVMLALACLWAGVAVAQESSLLWVFFRDKPDGLRGQVVWKGSEEMPRSAQDLPVDEEYLAQLRGQGLEVRQVSRWFNAASMRATPEQQRWLESRPFVRRLERVRQRRPAAPLPPQHLAGGKAAQEEPSAAQLNMIGVTGLHARGLYGQGMRIALLDNGFNYGGHPAFVGLRVVAQRDFVNNDEVVGDQMGQPLTGDETRSTQNHHGTQVLAMLAGREPGRFSGAAPEAEYLLAKTEENATETPADEDRWIAGLEWAASLGAQIINSSLGYNTWDDGTGYAYADLDGETGLTTRAAQLAVERGVVVVAAAGNEGNTDWHYLTTPADAPGVIAVGAVDLDGVLAGFSSRGPTADGRIKPDVVAPGEGVVTVAVRGAEYLRLSGTSFAAPLVSGVCALLRQAQPSWGPGQVQEALRRSAEDLGEAGPDTLYGWGLVDALKAAGLQGERPALSQVGAPFPQPALQGEVHFPLRLAAAEPVELEIFDLAGALVDRVPPQRWRAGDHLLPGKALRWQIPEGLNLAGGLYLYQVRGSSFVHTGKIALVRGGP
ncbi:MAG: S8 family serine peptidase [Candidatus Handelsmanbacteria bacterium]|nr:S8 family serine peptidase [Candidatus Handelsmanbacteria bacterium]